MMSLNTITKLTALVAATLGATAVIDVDARAPAPATDAVATTFSGDMTYFFPGLGACGENNGNNDAIVAVSPSVYNSGSACNRGITIHYNGRSANARIVDLCPSCATGSIDVSPSVFTNLVGSLDAGRVPVTWDLN
jgi:expansin (peptidoglycan-binding protein)